MFGKAERRNVGGQIMRYCLKCGVELKEAVHFCPQCGARIGKKIPNKEFVNHTQEPKYVGTNINISKIITIFLLVFSMVLFILTFLPWIEEGDIFNRESYIYYETIKPCESEWEEELARYGQYFDEKDCNKYEIVEYAIGISIICLIAHILMVLLILESLIKYNKGRYVYVLFSGMSLTVSSVSYIIAMKSSWVQEHTGIRMTSMPYIFLACSIIYMIGTIAVCALKNKKVVI